MPVFLIAKERKYGLLYVVKIMIQFLKTKPLFFHFPHLGTELVCPLFD